jgi:hypothetical protein
VRHDLPPAAGRLGDLHGRRPGCRPHPPNPRHDTEPRTPISALNQPWPPTSLQVSCVRSSLTKRGDQTQAHRQPEKDHRDSPRRPRPHPIRAQIPRLKFSEITSLAEGRVVVAGAVRQPQMRVQSLSRLRHEPRQRLHSVNNRILPFFVRCRMSRAMPITKPIATSIMPIRSSICRLAVPALRTRNAISIDARPAASVAMLAPMRTGQVELAV